jgi:hypothetical protein
MPINPPGSSADQALESVQRALLEVDQIEARLGRVLRDTIDQLLDGVHTGRYRWKDLYKTEKTHAGTLVEINMQREFNFQDGVLLDYSIAGTEVDCKYSQTMGAWMIPPETKGQLCMVVCASDEESIWSAGLVRAAEQHLSSGTNRDQKRTLSKQGRESITWLFKNRPLPPNVFLQLRADQAEYILDHKSGQERVNRLFTYAQGLIIGRAAVATAGRQDDFMKRARGNGGARSTLRSEGIVILGHEQKQIAHDLGLKVIPEKGELVSVRLARVPEGTNRKTVEISGERWAIALQAEPAEMAPVLPRAKPSGSKKAKTSKTRSRR